MLLKAKIKKEYLDQILSGNKQIEYREIEGIEFDDGTRKIIFDVKSIDTLTDNDFLKTNYPDVKWNDKLKVRIFLGNKQ